MENDKVHCVGSESELNDTASDTSSVIEVIRSFDEIVDCILKYEKEFPKEFSWDYWGEYQHELELYKFCLWDPNTDNYEKYYEFMRKRVICSVCKKNLARSSLKKHLSKNVCSRYISPNSSMIIDKEKTESPSSLSDAV